MLWYGEKMKQWIFSETIIVHDIIKVNRKVQKEPQAEAADNPQRQKEEKKRHSPTRA